MKFKLVYIFFFFSIAFSISAQNNTSNFEKIRKDYLANRCDLDITQAYFNLIDKEQEDEIQKVKSNYVSCLESSQNFSIKQVSFLFKNLVTSRNDTTYTFYLKNKPKFEKNYGDSLLLLEIALEEFFFIQDTDSLIKQIGNREKLTLQEIERFEKIVNTYSSFSKKAENESKEKSFQRAKKRSFIDYKIYTTAIQFYEQHKELEKFSTY